MWNKVKEWLAGAAAKLVYEYVFELILDLVLDRLAKYKENIDWDLVTTDINARIRQLVPGSILEETCIAVAGVIVKHFRGLMKDLALCKELRAALAAGDFQAAKQLVIKYFRTWVT